MPAKTLDQLLADLAIQEEMLKTPGIPEGERQIYRDTAAIIRQRIDALQSAGERAAGNRPATPAPGERPAVILPSAEDAAKQPVVRQEQPRRKSAPTPQARQENSTTPATARNSAALTVDAEPVRVYAPEVLAGKRPTLEIHWPGEEAPRVYSIGLAATSFRRNYYGAMRTRAAEGQHWHIVETEDQFKNAAIFYAGLCRLFRRADLTPQELGVILRTDRAEDMWDRIVSASKLIEP